MMTVVRSKTADGVWRKAVRLFRESDGTQTQDSRLGPMLEKQRVWMSIEDPRQRWIVSREPALNPAFALAEVIWLITGRNDSGFLNYWNSKLPKFAGTGEVYHGAYGHRLRNHFGVDQLERAYKALSSNPDSRQVVLQIWDGKSDLPDDRGHPVDADIPCNLVSILKVRDGKLEWLQIVRSNDLFLGVPHNVVQFTFLQEVMAGWLGLEPGVYEQISDSLHVYEHDKAHVWSHAKLRMARNIDRFDLPIEESEVLFGELSKRVDALVKSPCNNTEIRRIAQWSEAPSAFQNILLVLCAETARRNQFFELASGLMLQNRNPVYRHLWRRWLNRVLSRRGKQSLGG